MSFMAPVSLNAEEHALRQYLADLPEPADYAQELPLFVVEALGRVVMGRNGLRAADRADARTLRQWGLCDCPSTISDGRELTNFGRAVRRELLPWLES